MIASNGILPETEQTLPLWLNGQGNDSDIVVSTRIRLARNLAQHRFVAKASLFERKKIFEMVVGSLDKIDRCNQCVSYSFLRLNKFDQEFLVEQRLASPDLLMIDGERGVICDTHGELSLMVNEEDHIRMQHIQSGFASQSAWQSLNAFDDTLGEQLEFSYDRRRGFLTCCPTNAGTGLRVSFLIHLPGLVLTRTLDQVLLGASQMGICIRGFFGEHSAVIGNLFQLSNQATLGAREVDFITATEKVIERIIDLERSARKKVLMHARQELLDKIHRSFGILSNALLLDVDEYLNLSSALRFGIQSGIFDKTTIETLNRISLAVMPSHLQRVAGKQLGPQDVQAFRAEVVRKMLGG